MRRYKQLPDSSAIDAARASRTKRSMSKLWQSRYEGKLTDADRAVRVVKRGQRVFVGSGAAEPQALVAALTRRGSELADTEIVHILTLGAAPYTDEQFQGSFRHNAFFIGPNVRGAVAAGNADYTPIFLSEIPRLFRTRRVPLDVALIQVSPPDEHGFCSYGVSVDVVKSAAESAEVVIAEVNPLMPRTLGDSFIHASHITHFVDNESALLESVPAAPDHVAQQIGQHVARLIDSGSTLQMGIGMIPNAVLQCLGDKRDLGIHTEMFSDGIIDLIDSGVINCAKKTLLAGKVVSSFCMGTRRLYDYVHDNPFFEFRPVEFTNDPFNIARNTKMVAVNAALEVDLTGQVCADSLGGVFFSGIGGQVDFIRGAARSEGGKPIIVLRSTAKKGTVSRIVPHLKEGAGVVTTRGDVHFVATEYGVADLWGKSVRERALALINIAHPKFRAELLAEAKRQHLIFADQIVQPATEFPDQWRAHHTLKDGTQVRFRPIKPTDEPLMKELFYTCSEATIYHRFFAMVKTMPHSRLQKFCNVDYVNDMAVVGFVTDGDRERLIAVGRYALDRATNLAEVAFLVQDDYQSRGIGTLLLRQLMDIAKAQGLAGFTADIFADNRAMIHVLHKSGRETKTVLRDGIYHLEFRFAESA